MSGLVVLEKEQLHMQCKILQACTIPGISLVYLTDHSGRVLLGFV